MRKFIILSAIAASFTVSAHAQSDADNLMNMLDDGKAVNEEVHATFKATRLINGSSIESLASGVMDVRISHRFGQVKQGIENFFGIDNANTRLGLDYGITDRIMVGLGHNVLNKENDGFVKVKILKQMKEGMPVTLSYFGGMGIQTTQAPVLPQASQEYKYTNRLSYVHQVLVARKFSEAVSLQLMPTLLHINMVDSNTDKNDIFALGIGGRVKLSKRVSLNGEYFARLTGGDNKYGGAKTYNTLSVGFDIETGGHVFQLMFTNSAGMSERSYIGQTTDTWTKGEMHYGFNISRVFTIVKPKEFRKSESRKG